MEKIDPDDQPPTDDERMAMLGETLWRMRRARAWQVETAPHLARPELHPTSHARHEGVVAAWSRRTSRRLNDEMALVKELADLDGCTATQIVHVPTPPRAPAGEELVTPEEARAYLRDVAVVHVPDRFRREEAERSRLLSEGKVERDDGTIESKVEWLEPVEEAWLRVAEKGTTDRILAEARIFANELAKMAAPAAGAGAVAAGQVETHEQSCACERAQLVAAIRRKVARWRPSDWSKAEAAIRQLRARAKRRKHD